MATNSSSLVTEAVASKILPTNVAGTPQANQAFMDQLVQLPATLWENSDVLVLECRIVFTALACIYLGSHASLRRPPSANPPKKDGKENKHGGRDRDDQFVQGLLPSDAIIFPILAGASLVGLYYLIKWLEDPDILNKILRVYFSIMSLASLGKLSADCLHFLVGFIFPSVWTAKDGKLFHIDASRRGQWYTAEESPDRVWDDKKKTPLAGCWSEMNIFDSKKSFLWGIRHSLLDQWTIRISLHGIVNETFKVKLVDILGVVLAVGANVLYYATESTALSNIMGYAFSYTGILVLSPTTFTTGTAVLFGLFFYDIYMVFYTPYMVTVATKLDVPIKLVFGGPKKVSMLGLGDIVLPGIFIGLALRFDHYMYYHRQRKLVPIELKIKDESSGELVTSTQTQRMIVKPDYINPQGQWGDRFWSTKVSNMFSPDATPALKASAFPKPYFHATMFGYFLAMLMTLAMLLTYRHAQPALLYLVPGVVLAAWITGTLRGEIREMLTYTEDGWLDTADTIVEVDGNGNVIQEGRRDAAGEKENMGTKKKTPSDANPTKITEKQPNGLRHNDSEPAEVENKPASYPVFLFSIEAPAP
ncbi:signal peptide peptidase-domain-containing protein [Durotheca rogersii]|uniref:signal peptide peptidase-domain-containing protein n=1 Tax=Durotheca rogersii TaxID=419775 RepID=UPI00221F86D4|nr:signal peptide peptidase-domain-containing protein [Durotheca rogersii]KAI5860626.1 signal peptide peptidase-domain-containing protein [Durotheca rogersii]